MASSPSHWIHLQALCERTVALCFNGRKALRAAVIVICAAKKRAATEDTEHESVTFEMCIFSRQLANICTWVGMPTVPYWLPAVTQEDGKMEDREDRERDWREGGWVKGVVMM